MRSAISSLLTLILWGCAYLPPEVSSLQVTARDGGLVYYGTIKHELPAVVTITVEVDRRVYSGRFELTGANETFGFYRAYGPPDAVPRTAQDLSRTNYTRAILSSSDYRILRCDFTDTGGRQANGVCVDDARRVYDVVLS